MWFTQFGVETLKLMRAGSAQIVLIVNVQVTDCLKVVKSFPLKVSPWRLVHGFQPLCSLAANRVGSLMLGAHRITFCYMSNCAG